GVAAPAAGGSAAIRSAFALVFGLIVTIRRLTPERAARTHPAQAVRRPLAAPIVGTGWTARPAVHVRLGLIQRAVLTAGDLTSSVAHAALAVTVLGAVSARIALGTGPTTAIHV